MIERTCFTSDIASCFIFLQASNTDSATPKTSVNSSEGQSSIQTSMPPVSANHGAAFDDVGARGSRDHLHQSTDDDLLWSELLYKPSETLKQSKNQLGS